MTATPAEVVKISRLADSPDPVDQTPNPPTQQGWERRPTLAHAARHRVFDMIDRRVDRQNTGLQLMRVGELPLRGHGRGRVGPHQQYSEG